jgi:hypothetical protein
MVRYVSTSLHAIVRKLEHGSKGLLSSNIEETHARMHDVEMAGRRCQVNTTQGSLLIRVVAR